MTSMVLMLERGSLTATVPLVLLSNSPMERAEWEEYMRTCRKDRAQLTSVSEAAQIAAQIKAAQTCALDCACGAVVLPARLLQSLQQHGRPPPPPPFLSPAAHWASGWHLLLACEACLEVCGRSCKRPARSLRACTAEARCGRRYVYTPQDVQRMVQERRAQGRAANLAMHKAHLQQQLQHARDTDNEQLAAEYALPQARACCGGCRLVQLALLLGPCKPGMLAACRCCWHHLRVVWLPAASACSVPSSDGGADVSRVQQQLADLEQQADAKGSTADPTGKGKNMAKINRDNAARNFQNALHNVSARPGASVVQGADEVFARRSTRPMNYWATGRRGEPGQPLCSL